MNKEYKIYGLKVIGSDEIRYIGYTKRELILNTTYTSIVKNLKRNKIRKYNYGN